MAKKPKYEFKPDRPRATFLKRLYMTRLQRLQITKWVLLAAACVLMLVIQDVIMSRFSIGGATTDLVPAALLLITVISDAYDGSLFMLIASMLYVFSGSSPGPYAIGYLSVIGIAATLLRQSFWRRGFRSNALCAGLALLIYELAIYATGIFLSLTYWSRIGVFLLTWLLSLLVMLALYPLIRKIQKIGGETWKE